MLFLFTNDLHASSDVQSFSDDNPTQISFPPQPAFLQCSFSVSTCYIFDDKLRFGEHFDWGVHNLVKFNTSNTQLLTISPSDTHSNYPILFEDSEILPLNFVNS